MEPSRKILIGVVIVVFRTAPDQEGGKENQDDAPHEDLDNTFDIKGVATSPDHQNKGIMKLLFNKHTMHYLHEKAETHGVDVHNSRIKMFLEVKQTLYTAMHGYLNAGFYFWGSYPLEYTENARGRSK